MRLTTHQELIIAATHLQADKEVKQVCMETGLSDSTVRRQLRILKDSGTICTRSLIDFYALGYSEYMLLFSTGSTSRSVREGIFRKLECSGRVSYVAELAGEFEYAVSILARNIHEVHQCMRIVGEKYSFAVLDKQYAIFVEQNFFPAFTCSNGVPRPYRKLGTKKLFESIDSVDIQILSVLGKRFCISKDISRTLGLPNSTISYRMERLRKKGITQGALSDLNLSAFGFQSFAFLIFSRGIHQSFYSRLREFCRHQSRIFRLIHCIGTWDFMLSGDFSDPQQVIDLRQSLLDMFPEEIRMIKGFNVLKRRKLSNFPFLPREGPTPKSLGTTVGETKRPY